MTVSEPHVYKFDRFRHGKKMAEGATITRCLNPEDAAKEAARLFGNHPYERFVLREISARAEPSRGAPERAAKFYLKWANDSYGVYPDRKLPSEHLLHFAASFAASECVVLLEALRACVREMEDAASLLEFFPDDYGEAINLARAAIQQAERTCH